MPVRELVQQVGRRLADALPQAVGGGPQPPRPHLRGDNARILTSGPESESAQEFGRYHGNIHIRYHFQILVTILSGARRMERHTGTEAGKLPTAMYITGNS